MRDVLLAKLLNRYGQGDLVDIATHLFDRIEALERAVSGATPDPAASIENEKKLLDFPGGGAQEQVEPVADPDAKTPAIVSGQPPADPSSQYR